MQEIQLNNGRSLVFNSPALHDIVKEVTLFAPTDIPVLITGENGTGKDNIAQLIHKNSKRKEHPFHTINCSAISPNLIESELFGHEKGAFTDAHVRRIGAFEKANGGTLFLDEIGEMPPELQTKLLHVLEHGQFTRVGGTESITAKPRIISATNQNIEEALASGKLRKDLYYRLNGMQIHMPELQARPMDIPLLAQHFVKKTAEKHGFLTPHFTKESMDLLKSHTWPGNIRQLSHVIEQAAIRAHAAQNDITSAMLRLTPSQTQHTHVMPPGFDDQSFGYKLNQRREERNWTQGLLANKLNSRTEKTYSPEDVRKWEAGTLVPTTDVINTLAFILIVETDQSSAKKTEALDDFFAAASVARQGGMDLQNTFGIKLTALREAAHLDQTALAAKVTELSAQLPLRQRDIYLIENNLRPITQAETLALVRALDSTLSLSGEAKMDLYNAVKTVQAPLKHVSQVRNKDQIKTEIRTLLAENGQLNISRLAEEIGGNRTTVNRFLNTKHDYCPKGVILNIEQYLDSKYPAKAQQFRNLTKELLALEHVNGNDQPKGLAVH